MSVFLPAVTIASNNYLAMARVWAESYREHHPGAQVFFCVVDEPSAEVDYHALPGQVIFARDLPIPAFRNFAFRYDVLELNTAVKPFLLAHLRDSHGLDRVLYFDPDILVLDRLTGIEQALNQHPMALTPHVTGPLDDRRDPSERKIRMVGVYNLGFLGLRLDASTHGFLRWWSEKLYRFCRNEPWSGLFVDQAWMDFAPAFLDDVAILREPIYNVAYWNLPQRTVRFANGRWLANERPIGFFHFSGISFADIDQVSRHQDRLAPGAVPAVRPLFEEYLRRVAAAGHERLLRVAYAYDRFTGDDGPVIPSFARLALQRLDPWARRFTDPFDRGRSDSFFDYLAQPVVVAGGVLSRAALALWESRVDLRRRFPDPAGVDLPEFSAWLAKSEPGRPALPTPWLATPISEPWQDVVAALGERSTAASLPPTVPGDLRPVRVAEMIAAFDLSALGPLTPWLNDPVPGTAQPRPILTRLAMFLHGSRSDLEVAFPDPLGRDQRAYARWFSRYAANEAKLHPELVRPVTDSLPRFRPRVTPRPVLTAPEPVAPAAAEPAPSFVSRGAMPSPLTGPRGVNLIGPLSEDGGLGSWARGCLDLLRQANWPRAELDVGDDTWGQQVSGLTQPAEGVPFGLSLVVSSADRARETLGRLPLAQATGNGLIGLWDWPYGWFSPELAYWCSPFDELWMPSEALARVMTPLVDVPVRVVPPWLGPPAKSAPRAELGPAAEDDRFVFVATFGEPADEERENLAGLIAAVADVADGGAPVGLCLTARGSRPGARRVDELRTLAADLPAVTLKLDSARTPALIAAADAFVSLGRAEGAALDAAGAALAGKPVVAPAVGGLGDWLTPETGWPVPCRPMRLGRWLGSIPPTVVWADAAPADAATAMRTLMAAPEEARRRAEVARERMEERHGAGAGIRFRAELERLAARFPG